MPKYKPEDVIIFMEPFHVYEKGESIIIAGYKDFPTYYIVRNTYFTWFPYTEQLDAVTVLATKSTKVLYGKV